MVEAGVQGSSNELRQFGISLTDAAVRTEKLRSGITGEFEELSEASQAQIRYNLIIGQSAKLVEQASHAFNDPSAHLAVLSAHFQDLVQAIGSRLLPVYIKLIDALDWGVRSFNRLGSGAKTAITALAVAVPALGAIGTAIASLSSAAGVIRLAFAPILAGVEAALGGIGAVAGAVFSGLGAAVAAAVLSITALVLVVHHFHADLGLIVSDMAATVRGWLGKLADGIKWYLDQEKEIWGETFDQIAKGVGEAIKSILGKLAEVQDFMASHGLADKNGDDLRRMAAEVDTFGEKFKDASTQAWTMMKEVEDNFVRADETTVRVLQSEQKGKTRRGWLWTFRTEKLVAYRFSASRSGETPKQVLGESRGYLQVDAYTGYNAVSTPERRVRVGCWAHARRKFFEAQSSAPEAREMLDLILELYEVEREARDRELNPAEHLELRKEKSSEVLERIRAWLDKQKPLHPPKSPLGEAIRYALGQWEALTRFLESARIPLDNNASERALRPAALGRKNYLFVGNDRAGENIAGLYALVATCEENGINPQAYLADVLVRLAEHPQAQLDELLPHRWKPAA